MKNLFQSGVGEELKQRAALLRPESERQWGKMNAGQMLAHCSLALEWTVGDSVPDKLGFVGRTLGRVVKPLVLRDDKPFRRNSPTAKSLVITDERDLGRERDRLCGLIDRFVKGGAAGCGTRPHPFFGRLTPDEWATLAYKHLDHHLRQFGV